MSSKAQTLEGTLSQKELQEEKLVSERSQMLTEIDALKIQSQKTQEENQSLLK